MRIKKLDGLRGIFAFMIVLLHYPKFYIPNPISSFFIIRESWIFVEFFFVLSGFVISYNYKIFDDISSLKTFFLKRFFRLYPLLFFSTTVYLIFQFVAINSFPENINNLHSSSRLFLGAIDALTFMNSTPIFGNGSYVNGPSWSISAEMISYILFGIISYFFMRKTQIKIFVVFLFFSIFILFYFKNSDYDLRFLRGIFSFIVGFLIYRFPFSKIKFHDHIEYILPILIVGLMYIINVNDSTFHKLILINFVFYLTILILLKTNGLLTKLLEINVFQYLGRISYSVYLNHFLIVNFLPNTFFRVFGLNNHINNQILIFIFSIIIIIFYSNLTYRFVELKGSKYLKKI